MTKQRILVTGAAGRVGHDLTEIGALTHGGDYCGLWNSDPGRKFLTG